MPKPDLPKLKLAIEEFDEFLELSGNNDETIKQALAGFVDKLNAGVFPKESLKEVHDFTQKVRFKTLTRIYENRACLPGTTASESDDELHRCLIKIEYAINPPPPPPPPIPEMSIKPFQGDHAFEDEMVKYYGDPNAIGPIVTKTIDVVDRFTSAILSEDFEKAYSLISPMVKAASVNAGKKRLTLQQFLADHKRADKHFGGRVVGFSLRYFSWILADEQARLNAPQAPRWPKGVDPATRRSVIVGFWNRNGKEEGCWAQYKTTEENQQYYIAEYSFSFTSPE